MGDNDLSIYSLQSECEKELTNSYWELCTVKVST